MALSEKTHQAWAVAFAELLKKHCKDKLVSVVLYGSVASGREKPSSDLDLLIIIKGIAGGRYRRRELLDGVYEEWSRLTSDQKIPFISTIIKTPEEAKRLSPLYFDMVDRHRLLFDRDNFFKVVLDGVKRRLTRLGAQRKRLGQIEYWDLKPDYKPGEVFEI